jgi:hypothetical protein
MEEYLSSTVAAFKAGVSRERVVRAVQQGRVPGRYRDGRWEVRADGLEQLREQRAATGTAG